MPPSSERHATTRRKVAVALRYRRELESVPTVVAGGFGAVAERILDLARESRVPIHEDATLAEALERIGPEHPIPPELYQAVAEVIAFVYKLRPQAAT